MVSSYVALFFGFDDSSKFDRMIVDWPTHHRAFHPTGSSFLRSEEARDLFITPVPRFHRRIIATNHVLREHIEVGAMRKRQQGGRRDATPHSLPKIGTNPASFAGKR